MKKTVVFIVIIPMLLLISVVLTLPSVMQAAYSEEIVARLPEADATLLAYKKEGYWESFSIERKGTKQWFPDWRNSDNPTYAPQMFFNDINHDGQKEIIIVLTNDHGTGLLQQKVHVLHDHREILIEDPMAIVLKNVDTKLTPHQAVITIGNKKTVVDTKAWKISPENLFPDVALGSIVKFDIVHNELIVTTSVQISPGGFIGSIKITYELYKNRIYQAKSIQFISEP